MWYAWEPEMYSKERELQYALHFVSIPEFMVPENIVATILAKGSEKAGTDNSGKPCLLTKSLCPAN